MKETLEKSSPAVFVLILVCLFLPFTHISCQGERVATLSGIQLVTGTQIKKPSSPFQEREEVERIPSEPFAILATVAALIGIGVSFVKGRKGAIASAILGGAGLVFLLLLKAKIDNEVLKEGEGMLRVEYAAGFWLSLLLFLGAVGLNVFLFAQSGGGDIVKADKSLGVSKE